VEIRSLSILSRRKSKTIHSKGNKWTLDDLMAVVPGGLTAGLVNPSPPQPPKE